MNPSDSPPPAGKSNPAPNSSTHDCAGAEPLIDWAREHGLAELVRTKLNQRIAQRRRKIARRIGAPTCVAFLAGIAGWHFTVGDTAPPDPTLIATAFLVEPRRSVLADGSVVQQADESSLEFEIGDDIRKIRLSRGVAHFEVAKDVSRPFVVFAAGVEVRAVGTAFSVHIEDGRVEVIVTEGRVSVGHAGDSREAPAPAKTDGRLPTPPGHTILDAGEQAVIELSSTDDVALRPRIARLRDAEMTQRLAWRVPRLEFSATPLAKAVSLLNSHSRVQLTLADPELGKLLVSGVIRADQADAFTRSIGTQFGIVGERNGDVIVLRR